MNYPPTIRQLQGTFKWPHDVWNIGLLNTLPPQPWANYFRYETKDEPQRFVTGSGNFTLHRDLDKMWPGVYDYCNAEVSKILGFDVTSVIDVPPDIAKTVNGIKPHVDLGRPSALNIGLVNTSMGIFHWSRTRKFKRDGTLDAPTHLVMDDGGVYTVGVCWPHEVELWPDLERYVLTYALNIPYKELCERTHDKVAQAPATVR